MDALSRAFAGGNAPPDKYSWQIGGVPAAMNASLMAQRNDDVGYWQEQVSQLRNSPSSGWTSTAKQAETSLADAQSTADWRNRDKSWKELGIIPQTGQPGFSKNVYMTMRDKQGPQMQEAENLARGGDVNAGRRTLAGALDYGQRNQRRTGGMFGGIVGSALGLGMMAAGIPGGSLVSSMVRRSQ